MPKVSVIMPAHNAAPFIDETIASVLAQEGVDFELLIADDASTDGTRDRLQAYAGDHRVRLFFHESNRGSATTRNALIREARGIYITPCDADDLMLPDCLRSQAEFLDAHSEIGVVYGDVLVVWLDDCGRIAQPPTIIGTDCNRGWDLRDNLVNHGGSMSRGAVLQEVGGYDERVGSVDDWSLWLKVSEIARIHYLPGELNYVWRRHQASLTCVDPNRARDIERIVREAAARRMRRTT